VNKVRKLEKGSDRFEDPVTNASWVNQVHWLTNLAI